MSGAHGHAAVNVKLVSSPGSPSPAKQALQTCAATIHCDFLTKILYKLLRVCAAAFCTELLVCMLWISNTQHWWDHLLANHTPAARLLTCQLLP
jgi:hypothetical protein